MSWITKLQIYMYVKRWISRQLCQDLPAKCNDVRNVLELPDDVNQMKIHPKLDKKSGIFDLPS